MSYTADDVENFGWAVLGVIPDINRTSWDERAVGGSWSHVKGFVSHCVWCGLDVPGTDLVQTMISTLEHRLLCPDSPPFELRAA